MTPVKAWAIVDLRSGLPWKIEFGRKPKVIAGYDEIVKVEIREIPKAGFKKLLCRNCGKWPDQCKCRYPDRWNPKVAKL